MSLKRLTIDNFKSIKHSDLSIAELNVLIGENGTGKTSILDAMFYFFNNLTETTIRNDIFDENNFFSNEVKITLYFDLSEFVKISKSNSDELDFADTQSGNQTRYSNYYKTIISIAAQTTNKVLSVTLSQIKGKGIKWNYSYEERLIIKSLFPFFFIDTRSLDVTRWDYLWDILGELGKVSYDERKNIEIKVHDYLLNESEEMSKKLKGIIAILSDSNVTVKAATSKEFAKNLSKVYFSGEAIRQNGKRLRYYSTGTNSVKYIELMLKAIDEIAKTKLKEPIVLIDEPEISLHPLYMDELSEVIANVSHKLQIMISTHSARLTKNLISDIEHTKIYSVKMINKYTSVRPMRRFTQYSPESKYRVTDNHINAYFSRAILFVEGETELELFANPYLRILFPKLKYIDIFQAMSQTPLLNIMNPKLSHTDIPYICLIDLDKVIRFENNNKIVLQKEYFTPDNQKKERYLYKNKHDYNQYLHHLRIRIEKMAEKLRIHYYLPFFSSKDPNLSSLINAIHSYLMYYNVFCFSTTIEGCLITDKSYDFVLGYLRDKNKEDVFDSFRNYLSNLRDCDKVNVLRIIFNGKSDLLKTYKNLKNAIPQREQDILEKVMVGKKTSGWISEFLDGFFRNNTGLGVGLSVNSFRRYLTDNENIQTLVNQFKKNFPELYLLICKICDMIDL